MLCAKLTTIQVPFLFKFAIDGLADPAAVADASLLLMVSPPLLMLAYGGARISADGMTQLRNALFSAVTEGALRRMSRHTFGHLLQLELAFHLNRQTGALVRVVERGTRAVGTLLSTSVLHVLPTAFEVAVVSALLARSCGLAFSCTAVATLVLYASFTFVVTKWRTGIRKEQNRADNAASQHFADALLNYESIKYFDATQLEEQRYDKALATYEAAALRTQASLAWLNFGQSLIFSTGLSGCMLLATHEVLAGRMSIGDVVMVHGLLFQLTLPLGILGTVYNQVRQASIDVHSLTRLLREAPRITSAPGAPPLQLTRGKIEFDDVCFGYTPSQRLLDRVSFTVEPGQTLAVVGGSGSGKSTLLRLLFRFYQPSSGAIRIDGQDVALVDIESLRAQLSVIPQDVVLFNESVRFNLAYGRPAASEEQLRLAARQARIHDSIMRMPDGYDTMVGERGLKLSGGEKQRMAIARALLNDAPILLCDEATSAVDTVTESEVFRELRAIAHQSDRRKTCIMIAHRLSTVVDADMILVLRDGAVAEAGTHASLVSRDGEYAKLWAMQQALT